MMIQRSTVCRSSIQSSPLTSDEIHVAQILLEINTMIRPLESGSTLKWGTKKRRSRLDDHKTDVAAQHTSPPSKAAAAAASPVTPLAFSPSECDDQRSNHLFNKTSKKMSRGEYMEMIEELSQRRDLLRGEIENVTIYYNKMIAQNSQLKAMKQEVLNSWPRKEEPKLDGSVAIELIPRINEMSVENETHPQPLVEDQRVEIFQSSFGFGHINGLGSINHVGPIWIPDLNVSAEEMDPNQPLDRRSSSSVFADRRTRFAEARRRRMDIRVKSMRAPCFFKFPRTR